jgi:excisionase family DNA binding protein
MKKLLNVHEAAAVLRVDPQTVRRFVREGRLLALKSGQRFLFERRWLTDFMVPVRPVAEREKDLEVAAQAE